MAAVQAPPPAPAALTSPTMAPAPPAVPMAAPWGAGALHQRLNSFVKKTLLLQLVPAGAVVCDLFCGRGVDTDNWAEAQISKYVGVDLSASALEEAKEQWEKLGKPFPATFCELDPCMADLEKHLGEDPPRADVVTCLSHLQDCFVSEVMVNRLLQNVASLLKPGGYFFGATADSSTIWYKYQKAVEGAMKAGSLRANGQLPRVRTDLYSISFEDDRFHEYGSKYQLRFADESLPPQSQILVHFPSLIRRAKEVGLEYVEIQNLTEFYEDYRVPFADTLQSSCGTLVDAKGHPVVDGKSRLSPVAQDVLSLYTTFIFRKPAPIQLVIASQVPTPVASAPDVKSDLKPSPALSVKSTAPEPKEKPAWKKHRIAAYVAAANASGPKDQELAPAPEIFNTGASGSKPAEGVVKSENADSSVRGSKPPDRDPKTGNSQVSVSGSKPQERVPIVEGSSTGARGSKPPERIQGIESPGVSASKSKTSERVLRSEIPNPRPDGSRRESLRHGNRDPYVDNPGSSRQRSESQQRSDTSGRETRETERRGSESGQSQDSLKRKRSYTPGGAPSSGGESTERRDEWGVTQRQPDRGSSQRRASFSSEHQRSQARASSLTGTHPERGSTPKPASTANEPQHASGSSQRRESAATDQQPERGAPHKRESVLPCAENPTSSTATEHDKPLKSPLQKRKSPATVTEEHQLERAPTRKRETLPGDERDGNMATEPEPEERGTTQPKNEGAAMEHQLPKGSAQKRQRPAATEAQLEARATQKRESAATERGATQKRETTASEAPPDSSAPQRKESVKIEAQLERGAVQNSDTAATGSTTQKSGVAAGEPQPAAAISVPHKMEGMAPEAQLEGGTDQKGEPTGIEPQPERGAAEERESVAAEARLEGGATQTKERELTGATQKREVTAMEPQLEGVATKNRKSVAAEAPAERLSTQNNERMEMRSTPERDNTATEPRPERGPTQKGESTSTEPQPERVSSQKRDRSTSNEMQFERGSKQRRESPALEHQLERASVQKRESSTGMEPATERGSSQKRESMAAGNQPERAQGHNSSSREFEAVWPETTPQRYSKRRAFTASQGGERAAESSQMWTNRSNFAAKNEREPQGGPVYHPRAPFLNPVSAFGGGPRPIRAGDGRDNKSHDGPGLLGAAPPHIINSQRERRYDVMGPSEGARIFGHSQGDQRGARPRPMRGGSVYKDRGPAGPRVPLEFAGDLSAHNNGPGPPWEEHMKGDGRARNR